MPTVLQYYTLIYFILFVSYLFLKSLIFYLRFSINPFVFSNKKGLELFAWSTLFFTLGMYGFLLVLYFLGFEIGVVLPILQKDSFTTLGIILTLTGFALMILSHNTMGKSWRMGIDKTSQIALVTSGIFAHSRNPVYLSLLIITLGFFFILKTHFALFLFVLTFFCLRPIMRMEEHFLKEKFGDLYLSYRKGVRKFF